MACMEHACTQCTHAVFNNYPRTPSACPHCGGRMQHFFDEEPDRDWEPDYDDADGWDE